MSVLIKLSSCAAGAAALVALWASFGFPTPATSMDIRRLDRQQAGIATQLYQDRVHSLLSVQPPTDPVARQNWEEQLRQTRQQLDAAQQRQIELSK